MTQCYRMVAPEKGKRSHITLRGWFGKGSTEVFVDDEVESASCPGVARRENQLPTDAQSVLPDHYGDDKS